MRQIKNCKVGHFVKYNGVLCQVNCFFTGWVNGYPAKQATLIQVGHSGEPRRMFTPKAEEKVEYLGDHARDEYGNFWVFRRRDPVEEWNRRNK